jgi:hypothetical protein
VGEAPGLRSQSYFGGLGSSLDLDHRGKMPLPPKKQIATPDPFLPFPPLTKGVRGILKWRFRKDAFQVDRSTGEYELNFNLFRRLAPFLPPSRLQPRWGRLLFGNDPKPMPGSSNGIGSSSMIPTRCRSARDQYF